MSVSPAPLKKDIMISLNDKQTNKINNPASLSYPCGMSMEKTEEGTGQSSLENTNKDLPTSPSTDGTIFLCKICNIYSINLPDLKKHYFDVHNLPQDSIDNVIVPLKPLSGTTSLTTSNASPTATIKRKRGRPRKNNKPKDSSPFIKTGQVAFIGSEKLTVVSASTLHGDNEAVDGGKPPKRRPGRPRKTEADREKARQSLTDKKRTEEEGQVCQMDEQKMECGNCGKTFARLRQLASHRCQFARDEESEESEDSSQSENDTEDVTLNLIQLSATEAGITSINEGSDTNTDRLKIPVHEVQQTLNDKAPTYPASYHPASLKFYACPVCKKVFKTKQILMLHMASHTTDMADKPYKCSNCNYSTSLKANLKAHAKKHTNDRLHCSRCSFSCISKGILSSHMKKHNIKATLSFCDLCNCRMYSSGHLLRHLEREHDIKSDKRATDYYKQQKLLSRAGQHNLIFQCHICHRKFKYKRGYHEHMILHKRNKPFKCTVCPYASVRNGDLAKHVRKHWFIFICHLCRSKFLSLELLNVHLASHEQSEGTSDKALKAMLEQSINISLYQSSSIGIIEIDNKKDSCQSLTTDIVKNEGTSWDVESSCGNIPSICPNDKTNGSDVMSQLNSQDIDTHELMELGEVFRELSFKRLNYNLLYQIRNLYGENECPVCGKLFRFRPHLDVHKRIHKTEKEFKCEECHYSSHSKQSLERHFSNVHCGNRHKCPCCSFETPSDLYLQRHLKKHHSPNTLKCTKCDMTTESEDVMKAHITSNHPDLSMLELKEIMGRNIHLRGKNGQLTNLTCHFCDQVFRRVCDLRNHIWIHKGIYPYNCKLCKFKCRSKSNLDSHMFKHSDAKNHLCDECGKSFKMKSTLRTHRIAQHSADKQHSCTHCEFKTTKQSLLKHHMDVQHQQEQVKTFRCFHCMQYTNTKDAMRSHCQQEHPETIFDETLTYEVPEERITTLNISINHKDGALHYKCSQCDDVLLANNGELGQHLRETHGLAITTGLDVDGEAETEQLHAGNLSSQLDLSSLPQGLQVQLMDSMSDKASAEQFFQELIDIQEIAAAVAQVDSESGPQSSKESIMKGEQQVETNVSVSETIAAVGFLTASESLIEGGIQSQGNMQSVDYKQYITDDRSEQDVVVSVHEVIPEVCEVGQEAPEVIQEAPEVIPEASEVISEVCEVIPDALLEQEVTDDDGVKVQE
ncbi:zinc finger protein ZFAT-like [Asterias rubens]|uniref:zinc finger protein ZFAT-like n=1 Tax=Asterias rubens TaxID=7604 RepID=UPI0014551F55|nr:zinc finger protein ZFAT-like [Asterias rubens]